MEIQREKFKRLFVALVTPYKKGSFEVDEQQLRKLIQYFLQPRYIEAGIALIINPEAGELFYLSRHEKRRNVEIAVEEVAGRVPLLAGAFDMSTADTADAARDARDAGVDGLFVMPPKGTEDITMSWDPAANPEVVIDYWGEIANAGGLPLVCHPSASVTMPYGVGFPAPAVVKICEALPQIVGWKMTYSMDGYRIVSRALRSLARSVWVLGAPAYFFHEVLAAGVFDGTVTGSFNYALEPMMEHILAWRERDVDKALRIWDGGLRQLHEYIYDYKRLHIRYKTAAWLRGLIESPLMRPPMPKPNAAEIQTLRTLLANAGISVISDTEL